MCHLSAEGLKKKRINTLQFGLRIGIGIEAPEIPWTGGSAGFGRQLPTVVKDGLQYLGHVGSFGGIIRFHGEDHPGPGNRSE